MKVAEAEGIIPKAWQRNGGILIPMEKKPSTTTDFSQIDLTDVETKGFLWCNGPDTQRSCNATTLLTHQYHLSR